MPAAEAPAAAAAEVEPARAVSSVGLGTGLRVTLVLLAVLVLPFIPHISLDHLNTVVLASEYLVITLSLVLLVGLVGQISLAQAALVGVGAFTSALFINRFSVHFPFSLIVGSAAGVVTAVAIGLVALRVRGLFLAVATLIFAYLCDQYLFVQHWLVPSQSGVSIGFEAVGTPGTLPYFDLGDLRVIYFIALAVAAFSLYSVANLRDSRIGRAFASVRGSEVAAASLGIDVMRFKLLGFACAGALAGLGGALTMTASRSVTPDQFTFVQSLFFLSIAVVGGLRSIGGAIASSALFAGLVGEVFVRYPKLADYLDLISAGLLIVVLLFFQGGLGALPERLQVLWATRMRQRLPWLARAGAPFARARAIFVTRLRVSRRQAPAAGRKAPVRVEPVEVAAAESKPRPRLFAARANQVTARIAAAWPRPRLRVLRGGATGAEPAKLEPIPLATLVAGMAAPAQVAGTALDDGRREPVLIAAEHVTVRFGGLTAVNDASIQVCAGEIVGLIGPNGAGKTTLFNSLLGLNQPTAGQVQLYGRDVTTWPVHRRAALGVGRTFQILQLFGDLTVFDNLLVATHLQNRTGLWGSLFVTARARRREAEARARVSAILKLMDLEQFANRRVAGLPFGVLRLVEVARTLVTGARLVCFDEPASGLDSAETERLIEWFRFLRRIGITLLVIEHDVSMVVRLCDYIYVLDQGRLIAEGTPSAIQRHPEVIASYLGRASEEAV